MQINKSDRNDAAGIARIMQTGWFKEVRVKDLEPVANCRGDRRELSHPLPRVSRGLPRVR
jgi:transposase